MWYRPVAPFIAERSDLISPELGEAAQGSVAGQIGDDDPDRPVAFGLQRKQPVEFEYPSHQRRESQRLRKDRCNRVGIFMRIKDFLCRRTKTNEPSAGDGIFELERLDDIVRDYAVFHWSIRTCTRQEYLFARAGGSQLHPR